MILVKPSFEAKPVGEFPITHIERSGRICYKSEPKGDSVKFVQGLINRGHESVLEHFRVVVELQGWYNPDMCKNYVGVEVTEYSNLLSGNIRNFRDMLRDGMRNCIIHSVASAYPELFFDLAYAVNNAFTDLRVFSAETYQYPSTVSKFIHCPRTVLFICDRGVSHEIVRHRRSSFSQESTRFCNYSGGVTFVIPPWLSVIPGEYRNVASAGVTISSLPWLLACLQSEEAYIELLKRNWTPQQARGVLTNSTKTEVVMTTTFQWWHHFLNIRAAGTTGKPHPQMLELTVPLAADFKAFQPELFGDIEVKG
jgi:thymidylate synthase (FAD)